MSVESFYVELKCAAVAQILLGEDVKLWDRQKEKEHTGRVALGAFEIQFLQETHGVGTLVLTSMLTRRELSEREDVRGESFY